MNRVVVTGIGAVTPIGCSAREFWSNLLAGCSGVRLLAFPSLSNSRTRIGAQVIDFAADQHFSHREIQRISRSTQFGLVAASEAITDSRVDLTTLDRTRVAVVLGSAIGGFTASESMFQEYFSSGRTGSFAVLLTMNNAPASHISMQYGITGPTLTIDTACSSSVHAMGYALMLIRLGIVDIAVTGGADCALSPGIITAWSSLRALSERNELPVEACRPFSRDRDGMVLGEGAGILIFESMESAMKRDANIYAEVKGYGAGSDGYHITQPSIDGISRTLQLALRDADLAVTEIDYINAHATATQLNDKIETASIRRTFGERANEIPIVGIKPAIGHSMAASAAIEAISCVLTIQDGVIPQTLNMKIADPECDLDYVTEGPRRHQVRHVMNNAFAFGGNNAVLIMSRFVA